MPLLDLAKITAGLSTWPGFLRDRDRSLRSGNYPETTRYNYLLAAAQSGRYLGEYSPDSEADDAAEDPSGVSRREYVEAFQAWMIETRSASTALHKHKALQRFFKWLMLGEGEGEGEIDRSPMERVSQPKMSQKLIPVIRDEETAKVLGTCGGRRFAQLRDEAIIRLCCNTHGLSAVTCGPVPSARRPACGTCGWPSAGCVRSPPTASTSCSSGGVLRPGCSSCTHTGGGTRSPSTSQNRCSRAG